MASAVVSDAAEEGRYKVRLVGGAEEEVRGIAIKLLAIKNMLDAAENWRFMNKRINNWLSRIEHTIRDMDGVLDEWNNAICKLRTTVVASHNKKQQESRA